MANSTKSRVVISHAINDFQVFYMILDIIIGQHSLFYIFSLLRKKQYSS
ncbi:hypothetical protein F3157_05105 [Virgibacillus dakarensis]|nr:hypothetical protein [Lentibacillus populi]MBT2214358.1 hypothetical protein [Virgibacillus dakarensis]MTW85035.1 hypothetical protein [Virgibacillus dakarensis]